MTDLTAPRADLTRTTLGVLFVVLLAAASLWILRPFVLALVWAATIVTATWPMLDWLQARLFGRRGLAAAAMVAMLLLVFLIPVSIAIGVVVANADTIASLETQVRSLQIPQPPGWLHDVPGVGASADEAWAHLASGGPEGLAAQLAPYARDLAGWLLAQLGRFGLFLFDFALTALLAGILYARGEIAVDGVRRFTHRLAGERGPRAIDLAGRAIRSVALGVVLTALLQAVVGGIGLAVTGVPFAALLTTAMFVLSIAQVGAGPVLALATIWLFFQDRTTAGIVLAVWTVVVASMDNVIRPVLIRRGVELPLLLIFAGVIGGLIAFGVIGIFVGPVFLAVTHTLLGAWLAEGGESGAPTAS